MSDQNAMPLPERLREMAKKVAANDLDGATTRRLIQLDMLEAADLISALQADAARRARGEGDGRS